MKPETNLDANMTKWIRQSYSPKFGFEVAQQVIDENRSMQNVADAIELGKLTNKKQAR